MDENRIKRLLRVMKNGYKTPASNIKAGGKKATSEELDYMLENWYITDEGENSIGTKLYMISDIGREFKKS